MRLLVILSSTNKWGTKTEYTKLRKFLITSLQFTALSGRHSVLERPLSGENGRPFLVITPEIIGY